LEIAGQEMRRRPCILGRGRRCLSREVGREALVERLDRNVQPRAQRRDERLRLERLVTALALQGQRQPDDHALSLFGSNERGLPPASASVARPPPPPPMYEPSWRTTATASSPRAGSDRSKLTTSEALPSSTEPSTTASAFFCRRSWSERSRNVAPRAPFTSATN